MLQILVTIVFMLDLYKYQGVIRSGRKDGFGLDLGHFSNGANSGHCGIQLAILARL